MQWCEGWQDQYGDDSDELREWIEDFQAWVVTNLDTLSAIEKLDANLVNGPLKSSEVAGVADRPQEPSSQEGDTSATPEAPGSIPPNLTETLSKEEQERFRVTCEAQLVAWAERLRLVNPVTADTLLTTLAGPPVRMTERELKRNLRKAKTDDERMAIKTLLFQGQS